MHYHLDDSDPSVPFGFRMAVDHDRYVLTLAVKGDPARVAHVALDMDEACEDAFRRLLVGLQHEVEIGLSAPDLDNLIQIAVEYDTEVQSGQEHDSCGRAAQRRSAVE